MSLKDRIQQDMKAAMREKAAERLEAIRLLRAAIQRREVDERVELDDAGVIAVVEKLIKQGKDSISQFAGAGRDDLVTREQAALDVFETYLPAQMTAVEIDAAVAEALAETGAASMRDMGKVMGLLKTRLQGRADMAAVSSKVKARLNA